MLPPSKSEEDEKKGSENPGLRADVEALSYPGLSFSPQEAGPYVRGCTPADEPISDAKAELVIHPANWVREPIEVYRGATASEVLPHTGLVLPRSKIELSLDLPEEDDGRYDWHDYEWDVIDEDGIAVPAWISPDAGGYMPGTAYFAELPESPTCFHLGLSTRGDEGFGPDPARNHSSLSNQSPAPLDPADPVEAERAYFNSTGPTFAPPPPASLRLDSHREAYGGNMYGACTLMDWLEPSHEVTFSIGEPNPRPASTAPVWDSTAQSPYSHSVPTSSHIPTPPLHHLAPPPPLLTFPSPLPPPPIHRLDPLPIQSDEPYCTDPDYSYYAFCGVSPPLSNDAPTPPTPSPGVPEFSPPGISQGHEPISLHRPYNLLSQPRRYHQAHSRRFSLQEQPKIRLRRPTHSSSKSASSSSGRSWPLSTCELPLSTPMSRASPPQISPSLPSPSSLCYLPCPHCPPASPLAVSPAPLWPTYPGQDVDAGTCVPPPVPASSRPHSASRP